MAARSQRNNSAAFNKPYLRRQEAMEYLSCSETMLRSLLKDGDLTLIVPFPGKRLHYISKAEIDSYLCRKLPSQPVAA